MKIDEFVEMQKELLLAPDTAVKKEYMRQALTIIAGLRGALAERDAYNRKLLDENIDLTNENAAQRGEIAGLRAERDRLQEKVDLLYKIPSVNVDIAALQAGKEAEDGQKKL